jgi:hypothetical protein
MATKKACVIFTAAKQAEAQATSAKLQDSDYEVCLTQVTAAEASRVQAGNQGTLPKHVQDCLHEAEVCVILVDVDVDFGSVGGLASDGGCRVVTIGGNPGDLPQELDDIIDGHVPSSDAPGVIEIVEGRPERLKPDNTPAADRNEKKVKCQ